MGDLGLASSAFQLQVQYYRACKGIGPSAVSPVARAKLTSCAGCRWERTEEPFFVEEEREARLESLFEADLEVRKAVNPSTRFCSHTD